jgi:hypothetical protein
MHIEPICIFYTSCTRPRVAVAQSHPVLSTSRPVYKSTRVFECKVVSQMQRNRWRTFGDCFRLHRFLARYGCHVYTETWPCSKWRSCQISKAIGEQRSELGQSLKATSEEVLEIVAGSTPSPAVTGVVHVLKHSRNPRERRDESLKGIGPELSEQRGE